MNAKEAKTTQVDQDIKLQFLGSGAYYNVYEINQLPLYEGGEVLPQVVVKLLKKVDTTGSSEAAELPSSEELLEHLLKEQEIVERYFSPDFVALAYPFKISEIPEKIIGKIPEDEELEIGLIQPFVSGIECKLTSSYFSRKAPPELAERISQFISDYNRMRIEARQVIEDQIIIDFENQTLKLVDTNHLISFDSLVNTVNPFLEVVGIALDEESYFAGNQNLIDKVLRFFNAEISEKASEDYYQTVEELTDYKQNPTGLKKRFAIFLNENYPMGSKDDERNKIATGFEDFLKLITYFPPHTVPDNAAIHRLRGLL